MSVIDMYTAWKIAPGEHAEDWPVFSKLGCIGIGWLDGKDFRRFKDKAAVLAALERQHGKDKPGYGKGAAQMILTYTYKIKPGDIVVANDAHNRVVGIGIVESEYLPPNAPENPLVNDKTTRRHHARIVNWAITRPADIPGTQFFVQKTLSPLNEEKVAALRRVYRDAYPHDAGLARQLERLFDGATESATPRANDFDNAKPGRAATTTYRVLRDTALARRVKVMHNYECQVCGHTIVLPDGSRYAEAHHIRPLGTPHDGPDITANILCLCPNHHAECDMGVLKLSLRRLRHVDGHDVGKGFLEYHNDDIHGK